MDETNETIEKRNSKTSFELSSIFLKFDVTILADKVEVILKYVLEKIDLV